MAIPQLKELSAQGQQRGPDDGQPSRLPHVDASSRPSRVQCDSYPSKMSTSSTRLAQTGQCHIMSTCSSLGSESSNEHEQSLHFFADCSPTHVDVAKPTLVNTALATRDTTLFAPSAPLIERVLTPYNGPVVIGGSLELPSHQIGSDGCPAVIEKENVCASMGNDRKEQTVLAVFTPSTDVEAAKDARRSPAGRSKAIEWVFPRAH